MAFDDYVVTPLDNYSVDSATVSPLALYSSCQQIDVELRKPEPMPASHWHGQIEINIPFGSDVEYRFNNETVVVKEGHTALFWASTPHRLTDPGKATTMGIIHIPIHLFLSWPLNTELTSQITHGIVLQSTAPYLVSEFELARWASEVQNTSASYQQLTVDELGLMLKRLSLYGWEAISTGKTGKTTHRSAPKHAQAHVCKMLEFIARHHHTRLTVSHIAEHVNLNPNYAMGLFQKVMQLTIKQYITAMRVNHAKALLSDTDKTILDISITVGMNSISQFYETFQRYVAMTPHSYRKLSRTDARWGYHGTNPVLQSEKGACDGRRPLCLTAV